MEPVHEPKARGQRGSGAGGGGGGRTGTSEGGMKKPAVQHNSIPLNSLLSPDVEELALKVSLFDS